MNSNLAIKQKNINKKRKRLKVHSSRRTRKEIKYNKCLQKDKKIKRNLLILTALAINFMVIFTFKSYIQLNNSIKEYNNLKSQYTSYQLTRDRLNVKLEDSIDLKEIQRYAMENLAMVYENDDRVVYLDIDR